MTAAGVALSGMRATPQPHDRGSINKRPLHAVLMATCHSATGADDEHTDGVTQPWLS